MTYRDELIEAAAVALAVQQWRECPRQSMEKTQEEWVERTKANFREDAEEILDAILTKLEQPSEEMLGSAFAEDIWRGDDDGVSFEGPPTPDESVRIWRAMLSPLKPNNPQRREA